MKSEITWYKIVYFFIFRGSVLTCLFFNICPWKCLWNQISFRNVHFRGLFQYFGSQKGTRNILEMLIFLEKYSIFQHFQNIFGSPSETQNIAKDPGNERFRTRSDSTKIFMEKYLKTKKLEHFPEVRFFCRKNVTFSSIWLKTSTPPKKWSGWATHGFLRIFHLGPLKSSKSQN